MKKSALLKTLRRQVLDDQLGVVCCRPVAEATTYYQLALDALAPPAPARRLLELLREALCDRSAESSYEGWRAAFDLLEEFATAGHGGAAAPRILRDLGRHALRHGQVMELTRVLVVYRACRPQWPGEWDGLLPELSAAPGAAVPALREVLVEAWAEEQLPAPWGNLALFTARRHPDLLPHLRDPQAFGAAWWSHIRTALAQGDGRLETWTKDLPAARELLGVLPAAGDYRELFTVAVRALAQSSQPCDDALSRAAAAAHPAPEELARLLDLRGAFAAVGAPWADPDWRAFLCTLLRDPDVAARAARARARVTDQLSALLRTQPERWAAALPTLAAPLGAEYPGADEAARWWDEAAALPDLSPAHVQALGTHAEPAAWNATRAWTELGATLGARLRPADRAAWCGIGLDLLVAAQRWDPAALAATTARWRSFVHVLLMAQPALADAAGGILTCQRETLDGPLFDAVDALRPNRTAAELDLIKTCGVGMGRG